MLNTRMLVTCDNCGAEEEVWAPYASTWRDDLMPSGWGVRVIDGKAIDFCYSCLPKEKKPCETTTPNPEPPSRAT